MTKENTGTPYAEQKVNTYIILQTGEDERPSAETIRLQGNSIDSYYPAALAVERDIAESNWGKSDGPFYAWVLCPSGDVLGFVVYVERFYHAEPYFGLSENEDAV